MKNFRRILSWIMIGLIVETALFYYIDKRILKSNIKIESIKMEQPHEKKYEKINVKVPKDGRNISISQDGKYISYVHNKNTFNIINTISGKKNIIKSDNNVDISKYKWLKDRNRILIVEKEIGDQSNRFKLSFYDGEKSLGGDITHLTWESKEWYTDEIQVSPVTDIIYVKLTDGKISKLFKVDIQGNVVMESVDNHIGNIAAMKKENGIIYEDTLNYKLISFTSSGKHEIIKLNSFRFIGSDDNENLYFAQKTGNRVSEILYGNIKNIKKLNSIQLKDEYELEDIYISSSGYLYGIDKKTEKVKNLFNGSEFTYNGIFGGFYTEGFIYLKNNGYIGKVVLK